MENTFETQRKGVNRGLFGFSVDPPLFTLFLCVLKVLGFTKEES
jgi:hypothetical protein